MHPVLLEDYTTSSIRLQYKYSHFVVIDGLNFPMPAYNDWSWILYTTQKISL